MSKQVHWQLPFASLNGTQYRIDIYDDPARSADGGQSWPVQLVGGEEPIKTQGDSSDDRFSAMREQTGYLSFVDPDGTLAQRVIAHDNTEKVVKMVRVSDNKIVWQGFIGCEAYNQPYVDNAVVVSIPIRSMLAGMKNIHVDLGFAGIRTIGEMVNILMHKMEDYGLSVYRYYYPRAGRAIMDMQIDTTAMFELKEQVNENLTFNTPVGKTMYDILAALCQYMGWFMAEQGAYLYMIDTDEHIYDGVVLVDEPGQPQYHAIYGDTPIGNLDRRTTLELKNLEYKKDDPDVSVVMPAHSVEVVAKVDRRELKMGMQSFPTGDTTRQLAYLPNFGGSMELDGMQLYISHIENAHSFVEFGYMQAMQNASHPGETGTYRTSTINYVLRYMLTNSTKTTGNTPQYQTLVNSSVGLQIHAGAFYGRLSHWVKKEYAYVTPQGGIVTETKYDPEDTLLDGTGREMVCVNPGPVDGIHCVMLPYAYTYNRDMHSDFDYTKAKPMVTMRSELYYHVRRSYLNVQADILGIGSLASTYRVSVFKNIPQTSVGACLRFGGKYYTGDKNNPWSEQVSYFRLVLEGNGIRKNWVETMDIDETDGLLIPMEGSMVGEVELKIYPDAGDSPLSTGNRLVEMFITRLDISSIRYRSDRLKPETSRGENRYYKLLSLNSSEDVSIQTDMASDQRNEPSCSVLMKPDGSPMRELPYILSDGSSSLARPERRLLNTMAQYYSTSRRILRLPISRPDIAHQPLVRMKGYADDVNTQGSVRTYTPMAEDVDWAKDTSVVKMFENP